MISGRSIYAILITVMFFIITFVYIVEKQRMIQNIAKYKDSLDNYKDTLYWNKLKTECLKDILIGNLKSK